MTADDVAIVGGGLIGLGIAWRSALLGLRVTVIDDRPGQAASWAAAGMLAPVTEIHYGEEALLGLNLASARRYPSFIEELESVTGLPAGYSGAGTLTVAFDAGDNAALEELYRYQQRLSLAVRRLRSSECRGLEPMLAPGVRGGMLAEDDNQVNNRLLVRALRAAAESARVTLLPRRVTQIVIQDGRVRGVRVDTGETLAVPTVVLAAGPWSSALPGLPPEVRPPVRPVKGQILRLRAPASTPFLARTLRALVGGSSIYLVPRSDGEIVVGATVEEQGFDTRVTVEAVYTLLRDAYQIVPGMADLEIVEMLAALRPGSPDNAPLLGLSEVEGLVIATGHYRNGVLLTPITADTIASLLATGETPQIIASFSPRRFTTQVPLP